MLLFTPFAFSQGLTQTVRGKIIDTDSQLPLVGVGALIPGTDPLIGTFTDLDGEFRLENVPVGRVTLQLSYLGYEKKTIPNIVVNSGKEVILDLGMQESVLNMHEVVISAYENKGQAINEMSLVSARSVSAEETSRYAGGVNDPSRIVSSFAGVATAQDGGNNIIVRGNSPK
ncbi:carboxypeptidase-like regulatory domain-containing protein, partial [bacterium]|nr:carboxypeptidase-like regulatory domain-containing protein [bacterium]